MGWDKVARMLTLITNLVSRYRAKNCGTTGLFRSRQNAWEGRNSGFLRREIHASRGESAVRSPLCELEFWGKAPGGNDQVPKCQIPRKAKAAGGRPAEESGVVHGVSCPRRDGASTRWCVLMLSGVNRRSLNGSEVLVNHVGLRRLGVDYGRDGEKGKEKASRFYVSLSPEGVKNRSSWGLGPTGKGSPRRRLGLAGRRASRARVPQER